MKHQITLALCTALLLGPNAASSDELGAANTETVIVIAPYLPETTTENFAARCPQPGLLYEFRYADNHSKLVSFADPIEQVERRYVRQLRGLDVTMIEIAPDVDPIDAAISEQIKNMQYQVEMQILLCKLDQDVTLVGGELHISGIADGLRLDGQWSLDEIGKWNDIPLSWHTVWRLAPSPFFVPEDQLVIPDNLPEGRTRPEREELIVVGWKGLPTTLMSDPARETVREGELRVFVSSYVEVFGGHPSYP
jgi:hypothetical protein